MPCWQLPDDNVQLLPCLPAQRQVKEAIHIDNFGGKATLKRGNDKAKYGFDQFSAKMFGNMLVIDLPLLS